NAGFYAFQATASGTSGTVEPTWCQTAGCTVAGDGGASWVNIGKIGGQEPAFDMVNYRPGKGCTHLNTRIGKIYRSAGSSEPAGALTSDSIAVSYAVHGTLCANDGVRCNTPFALPDQGTIHDGGQML